MSFLRMDFFLVCRLLLMLTLSYQPIVSGDEFAGLHLALPDKAQEAYMLYPDAPGFDVVPRQKDSDMHPCLDCHDWAESDPTPRVLDEPHDNFKLEHGIHGKGEFWCFTCHHLEGDGGLRTLEGDKLPFDQAYIVCSQCHSQETRDWYFGAHGKRIGNWRGKRQILNCTVCHYQHSPAVKPRKPLPPRPVPSYVEGKVSKTPQVVHKAEKIWESYAKKLAKDNRDE